MGGEEPPQVELEARIAQLETQLAEMSALISLAASAERWASARTPPPITAHARS